MLIGQLAAERKPSWFNINVTRAINVTDLAGLQPFVQGLRYLP